MSDAPRRFDSSLSTYVSNAHRAAALSLSTEAICIQRWQTQGDASALDTLIRANLRHVVHIARRYKGYSVPLDELIAEGSLGLLRAADAFDTTRGLRFSTYAGYWIRSYMTQTILKSWSVVTNGKGALSSRTFFRLRRERARAEALVGADAAEAEISRQMGMTVQRIVELEAQINQHDASLSQPAFADASRELIDVLADTDDGFAAVEGRDFINHYRPALERAMATLDDRERFIIQQRFTNDERPALSDLGRALGVSRERARQLESRATAKLRRCLVPDSSPCRAAAGN